MNGGNISENRASYKYLLAGDGGGVYATGSTFNLINGTINQNTALFGVGIFSNCSEINVSGGSVSYNAVTYDERYGFGGSGGGFYAVGSEEYPAAISGGEVLNNSAEYLGGGAVLAYTCYSSFTGGLIGGNTAGSSGNGIFLSTDNGQLFLYGTPTLEDEVSISANNYLVIGDNFNVTTSIPVSMEYNGQLTQGAKSSDLSKFVAYEPNYSVAFVPNNTELQIIGTSSYSTSDIVLNDLVMPKIFDEFLESEDFEVTTPSTPSTPSTPFTGIPSSWATTFVADAQEKNLLNSLSDVTSYFQGDITREQFCRLVMNVFDAAGGIRPVTTSNKFTDTSHPDVLAANALEIVMGTSSSTFSPHANIIRQELAIMVMKTASLFETVSSTGILNYYDADTVAFWAKDAVSYAQAEGFLVGTSGNILPLDNLTCEQAIVVALRLLEKFA